MNPCPCGSGLDLTACCQPYISGERPAPTAEALMRSRYTAYVLGEIPYLGETLAPDNREGYDEEGAKAWSKNARWQGLDVLSVEKGGEKDTEGLVEFAARYEMNGAAQTHHERAVFRRLDGVWRYADGEVRPDKPYVRETPKVGRNEPCPCGSGKKFKKCCGA